MPPYVKCNTPPERVGINQRAAEIEFLRFVFAVLVVLSHSVILLAEGMKVFIHGALAVEFFFMLSGYLMMASLQKNAARPAEVHHFIFRKIKAFWPEMLVAVMLAIGVYRYCGAPAVEVVKQSYNTFLSSLLLLKMTGITPDKWDWNGPTWYLSSMVIGMCITYPLLKRWGTHAVLLLFALILCGFLLQCNGVLANAYQWTGITYAGNLRAVAELLLGAFAWQGAQWLRNRTLGVKVRALLALAKWLGVVFVLFISHVAWYTWDGACLVALWCVIVIAFSGQSLDRGLFQNRFCLFLGAFSLPLYLSHRVWTFRLGAIIDLTSMNRWEILLLLGVFSVASALVTMYGARLLRCIWKRCMAA